MLIGGNVVNRIAAVGMIIVAAFFLKYAYDQRWITPPIIVCIGFGVGLALLFGGSRFHKAGAEIFAQGLLGAGIAILYLSGYATFKYGLAPQPIALGIMSIVTAISIVQALRYDSLVVCILGLAGGFLTPLLLGGDGGQGSVNHFGLFAYLALLDLGLLAVALKKDAWAAIEPLALACTYVTYLAWADQYYTRLLFSTALPFVTVVWLLFCAADFCRIARSISTFSSLRAIVGVCNSVFFYIAMYYLMDSKFGSHPAEFKQWMALVSVLIGAVYFISMLALLRSRAEDRKFAARYALTAISMLVIATAIQYEGFWRVTLWAVEAAALVWCGLRLSSRSTLWAGIALSAVSVIVLLAQDEAFAFYIYKIHKVAFWNLRCMAFSVVAAVLGLIAWLFARSDVDEKQSVRAIYESGCCVLILVLLAVETNDYFRLLMAAHGTMGNLLDYSRYMAIGGVWALYALVLAGIGVARKSTLLQCFGLGTVALGAVVVAANGLNTAPTSTFLPVLNVRALGFGGIFVALLVAQWIYARAAEEDDWAKPLFGIFRIAISLLALELVTVETYALFDVASVAKAITSAGANAEFLRYLALGAVWVIYSLPVVWYGLRERSQALAVIGLCALGAGVGIIATQGFEFRPIEHFQMIANVRFAAFAVAVIGLLIQYGMLARRGEGFEWAGGVLEYLRVTASLLVLELASAEIWDLFVALPKHSASPFLVGPGVEFTCYLALGAVWVLYSLPVVWYGLRRESQALRVIGLCALGAGVGIIATQGFEFQPIEHFRLIANVRFAAFAIAAAGLLIHYGFYARRSGEFEWAGGLRGVFQVVVSLLIFELVTAETRDVFTKTPTLSSENMRAMMLSVVWLIYSFLLISFGFWTRTRTIRFVAIALFGIAIGKVFLSDLSFLQALYRIFSFAGLALILFATSYLYQRYRNLILDTEEPPASLPDKQA